MYKTNRVVVTQGRMQQGFTLIELLITVTIIGILAAIVYPNYTQYLVRTNRAAAEGFITGVTSKQQQYLLDARQYAGVAADPGDATGLTTLNITVPNEVFKNYDIKIGNVSSSPPTYRVTAEPKGTQATRDTKCGKVRLDQTGKKEYNAAGTWIADTGSCW